MPNPSGSVRAAQRLRRTRANSDSPGLWRRAAAVLTTLALAGGLAVVGAAAPASAHHNTITGKVVCAADGSASIEWTVKNSESNRDETITASSDTALVPVGTEIKKAKSATFVQDDVAVGTVKLTLSGSWPSSGATSTDSGSVTVTAGQCDGAPNVKKVTICHATGSATNPYVRITVSVNAFFTAGHDDHQGKGDIYPAFTYEKQGKTITVPKQGDQSLLAYEDCAKPFDWNWEYAAPTCKALTVVYPTDIPSGQANDVNVRIIADGKELTLNFHKERGTWSGEQRFVFADHRAWTDPDVWSVVWVQVAGTNYHWEGKVDCGDAVTVCHWDASTGGYERETLAVKKFFSGRHDAHEKDIFPTFTWTDWWIFFPIQKTQPEQGDQSLLQYPDCVKPPTEVPAPPAPAFSDTCGPDNEVFTEPVDTDSLDWTTTYGAGFIEVTLTAKPGFALPVGAQTEWTYPVDDEPCVVVLEGVPSFADQCGPQNESLTVPSSTDKVLWASSREGAVVTVTATAKAGFAFPAGTKTSWEFTVDDAPCVVGLEGAPSFTDACGPDNDELSVPESTDSVAWASTEEGGVITVTATAKPGFVFPAGTKTSWEFTVDDEPCIIELVGAPSFTDACGPDNDELTVPESTETIEWSSTEENGVITVTATAKPGSTFEGGLQASWTFTVDDEPCVVELVGAPTFADVCGPDNETLVVPESTETAEWTESEADGVITVTAAAKPGYAFAEGTTTEWAYAVDDADCIEPTLTGSTAVGQCVADAPWIFYDVELIDPDQQSTGNVVSLVLSDGTDTETIELGELVDGKLSGQHLWPGASVGDDGVTATGWPGWEQLADGTWQETDGNFAWTRDIDTAVLKVNPELAIDLAYPDATPECAEPGGVGGGEVPPAPPVSGDGDGDGSVTAEAGGTGLASTGFAGTTIAIVAGIIVLAGAAFLAIARIRRKRA